MARPKKISTKAKEPVTIRLRERANGNKAIYLDIYRGGVRTFEYPKLYIIPERPGHPEDKTANDLALAAAQALKTKRMEEILKGEAGIRTKKSTVLLLDWMQSRQDKAVQDAVAAGRTRTESASSIRTARLHLARYIAAEYKGRAITLPEVDKAFCAGFVAYLKNAKKSKMKDGELVPFKSGERLSVNSCNLYYSKLAAALSAAVKKGLIPSNPATMLEDGEKAKIQQPEREYLTVEEVRVLEGAPCSNQPTKDAFLFCCACGLRWSDVKSLTWDKINTAGDPWQVEARMAKTGKLLYLPLSGQARKFLPAREDAAAGDLVFQLPTFRGSNDALKRWVKKAGIGKDITFHSSRHTFATMLLTQGADLYTVSKLLGHSDIKVTQIYAAIIDKKKQDAVNLLNNLF